MRPAFFRHVAVHRTHTRIVETSRDGVCLLNLSVIILHHQHLGSVQNTRGTPMDGGGGVIGITALSACFGKHYLYAFIVHIVIDGASGVATSSDAGDKIVRIVAPYLFLQLPFYLLAYNTLHASYKVGVGVRSHSATYYVEGVSRVTAPVAYGLRAGIAQCHIACANGMHLGTQHLHPLNIGVLTLHVCCSHEYFTLHVHQRTHRSCCHTVLSGSRLSNDASLAHTFRQEDLTDGVVNLVSSRVVQVLTL